MEVLEFVKQKERMCDYYDGGCTREGSQEICPAHNMNCVLAANLTECFVAVVEQWAKEHPEKPEQERQKPEQERQKPEQEQKKAEQEDIEGAISSNKTRIEKIEYDVSVIRYNLAALHDKIFALSAKIDHTPTMESGQTPEQKRTNKDVLLAAFPNARMDCNGIPDMCPLVLDSQYDCNAFASCSLCKRTHWSAEVEE